MRKSISSMMFTALAVAFSHVARSFHYASERILTGAYWILEVLATPATLKLAQERWDADERMYSQRTRHRLNIFSHDAKATGALCSPSLA